VTHLLGNSCAVFLIDDWFDGALAPISSSPYDFHAFDRHLGRQLDRR
jgi:hypothetical protein